MSEILEQFKKHGMDASYHFADDTCKEWAFAYIEKEKALTLFNDHPELQPEMIEIAKSFLWTLDVGKND